MVGRHSSARKMIVMTRGRRRNVRRSARAAGLPSWLIGEANVSFTESLFGKLGAFARGDGSSETPSFNVSDKVFDRRSRTAVLVSTIKGGGDRAGAAGARGPLR